MQGLKYISFDETIKSIFFHITATDISYENREILYYYLIEHQEMLKHNIYKLFKDDKTMRDFLLIISPINNEEQPFSIKELYSTIFLILFLGIYKIQLPLTEAPEWELPIISAIFNVIPYLNNCELFIHALAFISNIYEEEDFPLEDELLDYICEYFDSSSNFDENENYTPFFKLYNKSIDSKEFLSEICAFKRQLTS